MIRTLTEAILGKAGLSVIRRRSLVRLNEAYRWGGLRTLLLAASPEQRSTLVELAAHSKSQFLQDIFVAMQLGLKQDGFFVEFGATDGVQLSNSHMLETQLGWRGILAEPARQFHEELARSRKCVIDKRCVFSRSGESVNFDEVAGTGISQMSSLKGSDGLANLRRQSVKRYQVPTISLVDLLHEHGAPRVVDYISIDVEGGEYEILRAFDFSQHTFCILTVEHNFRPDRAEIQQLLHGHGYRRVFEEISSVDDWYVHYGA